MAVTDELDFLPLFPDETESVILARMEGWANEGLDPSADADLWVDVREGSHWRTTVQPCARELARFYDRAGTEVPMSGMVIWSWGSYLDDLASIWGVTRLAAVAAAGTVTFTGPEGTVIGAGTTVAVEPASEDEQAPEFETTTGGTIGVSGELDLPIQAVEPGSAGDVSAGAITVPVTPLAGVELTNAERTSGGTDVETDEALVERLLEAFEGKGPGTRRDYRVWAREQAGVGRATVIAGWNGPGTVLVIVTDPNGQPASPEVVEELQLALDPVPGQGDGKAPVGAIVTVQTAATLGVSITAIVEFEEGYSLDGTGGTIALRGQLEDVLEGYVEGVQSGEDIVLAQVEGRIAVLPGVHDVANVTINGRAANLAVPTVPAQVPVLSELALTEGVL